MVRVVAKWPLLQEEFQKSRFYKYVGKIYHDLLLGSMIRLRYRGIFLAKKLDGGHLAKTILFHPSKPGYSEVLYKVCNSLGYAITTATDSRPDLVIAYEDVTERGPSSVLAELAGDHHVVNHRCHDISKVRVEAVFHDVFGYGTFVDPRTHQGLCVVKSNENARHDGEMVACPTDSLRRDAVYQKLINNVVGDEVLDMRVPIVGEQIPFVYLKYRSLKRRFSNMNTRVSIDSPESVFSDREIEKILDFVEELGLDYGELDILRDVDDRKIYIVDVNNTPCGPPNHLGRADGVRAIHMLSESFHAEFLDRTVKTRDVC